MKTQSIFVFLDIVKLANLQGKNVNVSRNQGVRHVIQILFKSPLGKV